MSTRRPHASRASAFNSEEHFAERANNPAGVRSTRPVGSTSSDDKALALLSATFESRGGAAATNRDHEQEWYDGQGAAEEWERRRSRAREEDEEGYSSGSASDRERYHNFTKPKRSATLPKARRDRRERAARFFNHGPVKNQVSGTQHINGGQHFDSVGDDSYHASHRRGQEQSHPALRRAKTDTTDRDVQHGNPLMKAASLGQQDRVKRYLKDGSDVNACGGTFGTALQAAAANGQSQMVMLLLLEGAEVNKINGELGSALHAAAAAGCITSVGMLLIAGADVHARGGIYDTVMRAAKSRKDNDEVEDWLFGVGASV